MIDREHESSERFSGRGIPLLPDEPTTIGEIFQLARDRFNRSDALVFKCEGEWRKLSSEEVVARGENIAAGLFSLGLRKGDRAAILAANSPEWTIADAGCQFAGIVDVPIYTTLAVNSIKYILNDSGARVLFLGGRGLYSRIASVLNECRALERIVFFGKAVEIQNAMTLAELESAGERLRRREPDSANRIMPEIRPDDIATLIYTSGTTGDSKGVMLTHTNIISNVIDAGEMFSFGANDVPLSVLPLSHVFERSAMYLYILNGMSVHYAESIDKVPDNLREVRPTIFVGVPRIFEKVYARAKLRAAQSGGINEKIFDWAIDLAIEFAMARENGKAISLWLRIRHRVADLIVFRKLRKFFGGRLRACITGGAAISDEIYLIFTGAGIPIMQGYGLTETSPVVSSNNPTFMRLGTVGKPIRNVSVRIADDGEIEVRGPGVMLGYYNKEEATREAFTSDGWLRTGDIGRSDSDSFLRITDRKKELFKTSGGKYIAPSHIERMIAGSRFVNQTVLVGNGRKFAAALIVPNFEMLESYARHKGFEVKTRAEFCEDERIIDLFRRQISRCTAELARFESVKSFALVETEFTVEGGELTPTLKIKRRVIDEKYRFIIDKIYSEAEAESQPE